VWKIVKRWRFALPLTLALLLAGLVLKGPWQAKRLSEREAGLWGSRIAGLPSFLTRSLREGASRFTRMWDAESRARHLEEELALLRLEYRQLEESYERALKRGHILEIHGRYLNKLIPASLLARDPSTWFHVIMLDKGSDDGVAIGAGVMNPQGVLGRVLSVQASTCKVLFLTDPSCRLSVRDARSRVLAVLTGDGRKACRLDYVGGQDDVRVGDLIETAPGGLSFPSGIPAGTVTRLQKIDNGLKLMVEVAPAAETSLLEGLFISGAREAR
jgi:rod shape-determining protein MreC